MKDVISISPRDYDLVLFDLDGVLTKTAKVHAAAWKKLFDAFLRRRAETSEEPFVPFDIRTDYHRYVDGKPRHDGVTSFLKSRSIELSLGGPEDDGEDESIYALGMKKDGFFHAELIQRGVETYDTAIELIHKLRARKIKTAVVSSSGNCETVLETAGIAGLFDVRVDGKEISRLGLAGKPAPDSFLEAARRLKIDPSRAVVVEDAVVGVEAGHAGGFGFVIGIDHGGRKEFLREAGADIVVTDLSEVRVAAEPPSPWSLVFEDFDPETEKIREALCTLGNGYFATRGAALEAAADEVHYPGTYLAGGYNRLRTDIEGRVVENEDLVNFPNWLVLKFRVEDGTWFETKTVEILSYRQELDLRRGILIKTLRFEDDGGRRSSIEERRFVSMRNMHLAALELKLTPENWSGRVTIHSGIEGRVRNTGAKLYRKFNNKHLDVSVGKVLDEGVYLQVRTSQSNLHVAQAALTRPILDEEPLEVERRTIEEPGYIGEEFTVDLEEGRTLSLEKVASLYTSRDRATAECGLEARKMVLRAGPFAALAADHILAWEHLWRRFEVRTEAAGPDFILNLPMLLRLNMFHLLQAVSPNSIGLDIGVPARGWTGEAYQGHIFWDELFIFPFFNYRMPEITRSLLMYRYRRLGEARVAAKDAGFRGAMFPWQSGSNGREETQAANLNPRSKRWITDNSYHQRHVGSAVAYNVWQYYQVTHDVEFLDSYGAELILDIAHFWSSITVYNEERRRYEIHGVMGPDEFHDAYPDSDAPGLKNNAYTNILAVWVFCRALDILDRLSAVRRNELMTQLDIGEDEIARWDDISRKMFVPFHDEGIISQFEGYEKLKELDWDEYRNRYGNIQRLDLILESEKDSTNRYKLSKQADVLMLFYLFSAEEMGGLFERLGYRFEYETIPRNVRYYARRSSHGSTLSRVVYAWVLARSDRFRAMAFFAEALQSDVNDIQQGTTEEGVHLGAMAGTVDIVQRVWTGLEVRGDVLRLNPELPREMKSLEMRIRYRGHSLDLKLTRDRLTVQGGDSTARPIFLSVGEKICEFSGGTTCEFDL